MPVLIVYGMPANVGLDGLLFSMKNTVAVVLHIAPDEVSVFFPTDLVKEGLGEELICLVEGLFKKPERTLEIRRLMAESIRQILVGFARDCLPQCKKVEVIVSRFDQDVDGFAVWERNKK